jgi:hypothetical protein
MTGKQPMMVRLGSACDKRQFIEEPDEVKVSRPVLKTSGSREGLAEFNKDLGGISIAKPQSPNPNPQSPIQDKPRWVLN